MRCDRFDGFPCLTDGKADAHVRCVRPALEHPNVTLRTPREGRAAGDRRLRALGHVGRRRPQGRRGALQRRRRRRLVRRGELGGAAAALGERRAPARPGERVRRRRAATTWPHINSGVIAISHDAEPDEVPEDARRQRLLLGRATDFEYPLGAHPDARQERPQHPARRRAVVRAGPRARLHGQARDRLLADDRGPPASRQPRHGRPPGPHPPRQDRPQHRAAQAAARASSRACSASSAATRRRSRSCVGPRPAHPARRRRAPVRHRALRDRPARPRRSTSTAARTTSTTSTSSTRASSRRRAR